MRKRIEIVLIALSVFVMSASTARAVDSMCFVDMPKVWKECDLTRDAQTRLWAAMDGGPEQTLVIYLMSYSKEARERVRTAVTDGLKYSGYAVIIDSSKMPKNSIVGGVDMTNEVIGKVNSGEFAVPPSTIPVDSGR